MLKDVIATAPALALPQNLRGGWILQTDTSQVAHQEKNIVSETSGHTGHSLAMDLPTGQC